MIYDKRNYILIIISIAIIIIGFMLMSSGNGIDSKEFNPEIFSTRRIVVAPIVCVVGFSLMVYAILFKSKNQSKIDSKDTNKTINK